MNVEYIVVADTVQQAEKIVLELKNAHIGCGNRCTVVINTTNTILNINNK